MSIDWKSIRSYEHSQNTAFEEVVCQLAFNENKGNGQYVRVKAPDGGVESYLILEDCSEIGWQAKYFFDIQDSQFKQIKKSFETAISKHPKLTKYYVCCPIDKQDPRIPDKKYLQDRWEDFVTDCQTLAREQGITIEIEYWGAFELNNMLQQPENAGMVRFWFGGDDFSDEWFTDQVNISIKNLGARYSAELNVEIHDISHSLNALLKNEEAKNNVFRYLNSLYEALRNLSRDCEKHNLDPDRKAKHLLDILNNYWKGIENNALQIPSFTNLITECNNFIEFLGKASQVINGEEEKYSFREELYKFRSVIDDLDKVIFKLFTSPYLIVHGDAGIGKSHLLGDFASNILAQKKKCVFILGQMMTETTNPWTQILKNELRLDCNEDIFLGVLNTIGQAQQERVPIIIDALNEGEGRKFWKNTLAGFIEKFRKYPWVALVLSVRSEYKDDIIVNIADDIENNTISTVKHYGFQYNVFEAIQSFFNHYQLALPNEPLLVTEFTNPLFLKIYCEYRKNTLVNDFEVMMSDIFNHYFGSINKKLAEPFGYRSALNYVQKVLKKLAKHIFYQNDIAISYEAAIQITDEITYSINSDSFLQSLLAENLLISYTNQKDNTEVLYFSYERFYDYLSAQFICDENTTEEDFLKSFSCDEFNIYYKGNNLSQGVLSVLATLIPIKISTELFEILDENHIYENYHLGYAFIESLYWRDENNLNLNNCKGFINNNLFRYDDLFAKFINVSYQVAGKVNHPLNANKLHSWLSKYSLSDRDGFWTTFISRGYFDEDSAILTLIEWAKKYGFSESLSANSRYLIAVAISWIFTSTNIQLRDNATIALSRLLQNHLVVSADLIVTFKEIDDPYVYERVLASVYGSILSSQNHDGLDKICRYLIEKLFSQAEVYPNVLVRDYARNIIEYANTYSLVSINIEELILVRPPYKSFFPNKLPTNDDIDSKYKIDYKDESIPKYHFMQNTILDSMTTEYGRGTGWYGDFGRYTFQSHLYNWDNVDIDKLSNYAIQLIFEKYGYDANKHGNFDRNYAHNGDRHENRLERIGKKYQWLAMYEVVARIADNFKMTDPATKWKEDKKLVWYNGSVEPSFRDIDPTFISPDSTNIRIIESPKYDGWSDDYEAWVVSTEKLIDSKELIVNQFDNNEWLSLHRHIEFEPSKKLGQDNLSEGYQRLWYMVKAYLVKNDDFETVLSNIKNKNFMGQWMPQPTERYNDIFNLEYYWSPLLKIFENEYYGSSGWQQIHERRSGLNGNSLGCVYICSENHISEGIKNRNVGYNISAPTQLICESLNLKNDKFSGSWVNEANDVLMFDASLYGNKGGNNLVIKKEYLEKLQESTGCKIIWTVLAEKIAMYGGHRSTDKRLDISGVYHLEDGKLLGEDYYFVT